MRLPPRSIPQRRLTALLLIVLVAPFVLLLGLGWRLVARGYADAQAELAGRRLRVADEAVASLAQRLASAEGALGDSSSLRAVASADDVVALEFDDEAIVAHPPAALPFVPRTTLGPEAPASAFEAGAQLARAGESREAARWFRQRAGMTHDRATRVGALIRLAQNLRAIGQDDGALDAYTEVAALGDTSVAGVPADLFALWARCTLLEERGRHEALKQEAGALAAAFHGGRWLLDRAAYEVHAQDLSRWTADAGDSRRLGDHALALGAEWLWREWQASRRDDRWSGRKALDFDGRQVTVLWSAESRVLRGLVLGPKYVEREWTAPFDTLLDREDVRLSLLSGEERMRTSGSGVARRLASDTNLPWTIEVDDRDPGRAARATGSRTIRLAGLGLLAVLVAGGAVLTIRAVARELEAARLQSDFVAAVSHELRTPLTTMRQLTESLIEGRLPAEERRDTYYRALGRQTHRLHRLVENLLDFGRMQAGTAPYCLQPLDICPLVRSIAGQFAADTAARAHRVSLTLSPDADGAIVRADAEALATALWNLLDNAAKYSPSHDVVWIEITRSGERLAIAVSDRGLGIPAGERSLIFGRFVRGAEPKTLGIAGTGIGLAMVRHIVSAHAGEIVVHSAFGDGSTFTILLPIAPAHPQGADLRYEVVETNRQGGLAASDVAGTQGGIQAGPMRPPAA